MIIRKLNGLFHKHSRVLFGLFTIIIIIAFMDFLTPGNLGGCSSPGATVVGTAYGEDVSVTDLQSFGSDFSLAVMLVSGQNPRDLDWEFMFQQYCIVKLADEIGVYVTDQEVADEVINSFSVDGKFSEENYNEFLNNYQITDADVASAVRLLLTVNKLRQSVAEGVVVSDSEAEHYFRMENAAFELDVCSFKADKCEVDCEPASDEELTAFYEANRSKYIVPGNYEAVLAQVPFGTFTAEAEKNVTAEDVAAAAADLEEDVRASVRESLVAAEARKLAEGKANELYRDLNTRLAEVSSADEQLKIFNAWAADNALITLEEKSVFGARSIGGENLPTLCSELQSMPRSGLQITYPAVGGKGIYFAILKNRTEPRQLDFTEAKERVISDRLYEKRIEAARSFAELHRKDVSGKDAAQQPAAFAAKGEHKSIKLPLDIGSLGADFSEQDFYQIYSLVRPAAMQMAEGEISEVINIADGAIIVRVVKRIPADMSSFAEQKEMLISRLRMVKSQMAFEEFINESLRQCSYTFGTQAE